jgi:hypothetical protein
VYVAREKLDRRRLLEAHFKYAILTVTLWYPELFQEPLVFLSNIRETLSHVTPEFQKAFHIHYSGMLLVHTHLQNAINVLLLAVFNVYYVCAYNIKTCMHT